MLRSLISSFNVIVYATHDVFQRWHTCVILIQYWNTKRSSQFNGSVVQSSDYAKWVRWGYLIILQPSSDKLCVHVYIYIYLSLSLSLSPSLSLYIYIYICIYTYVYILIHISHTSTSINRTCAYIYIYIYREREREMCAYIHMYISIYQTSLSGLTTCSAGREPSRRIQMALNTQTNHALCFADSLWGSSINIGTIHMIW